MSDIKITQEGVSHILAKELDSADWLYNLRCEDDKSITVYCSTLNHDIMTKVPQFLHGYQIKLAFAANLCCEPDVINLSDDPS